MSARRNRLPLRRLDAALARETQRLRARYQLSLDEFRGLFISDEQVDALLAQAGAPTTDRPALPQREPHEAIDAIAARFHLDETAADILLLALAPDADPAYAQIYAYLNDDVRRRWPTIDLACCLFGEDAEAALAAQGPLFGPALLLPAAEETRAPLRLIEFAVNPVVYAYIFGETARSRPGLALEHPQQEGDPGPIAALSEAIDAGETTIVVMTGAFPDCRAAAVAALAQRLGRNVARVAAFGESEAANLLRDGVLLARLSGALLLIEADAAALSTFAPTLRNARAAIFLSAPADDSWRQCFVGLPSVEAVFASPDGAARRQLWASALQRAGVSTEAAALKETAERFRLSPKQIETAALSVRLSLGLRPARQGSASADALLASARRQAGAELGNLAQRMTTAQGWSDLVLPPAALGQLRRFSGAIRHRERVFGEWGLGGGPGVTGLFSGSPGTGKSMAAGVLAREAGLDLWRIDLSAVVSKYIGETEKQLDRVFALARNANAVLFFDEADALFGKRSEVKDAHDRYANIEVAFLLQRLEAFDGVVILASNLSSNVDPAFSRRMHFVIDFPLPDPASREQLWRAALPKRAPLAQDVDLVFLARQFALAGGDIRVAALDAAFAAAADEGEIDMARLCKAVSRQLLKKGKVPAASDFKQYQELLAVSEMRMAAE